MIAVEIVIGIATVADRGVHTRVAASTVAAHTVVVALHKRLLRRLFSPRSSMKVERHSRLLRKLAVVVVLP